MLNAWLEVPQASGGPLAVQRRQKKEDAVRKGIVRSVVIPEKVRRFGMGELNRPANTLLDKREQAGNGIESAQWQELEVGRRPAIHAGGAWLGGGSGGTQRVGNNWR